MTFNELMRHFVVIVVFKNPHVYYYFYFVSISACKGCFNFLKIFLYTYLI